ncbi:MAG: sodium/proline symporter [Gammaproteobacteria bacterium]
MSETQWLSVTLAGYVVGMIAIGLWASRRTRNQEDFFLAARRLGPWIAALSASASSSSAWFLLGVSGAAYTWGLSAVWLLPSALLGYLVAWLWVGPKLQRLAKQTGAVTLSEFLFGDYEVAGKNPVIRTASVIILVCFVFYVAAQFQGAALAFSSTFGLAPAISIGIGAAIVLLYTLLGGFWAVSLTDTVQALLMLFVAVLLPLICVAAVGGYGEIWTQLQSSGTAAERSLFGPNEGIMAAGFVIGMLSIGAGYPGQPHVMNRFMALRDMDSLRQGRYIAIGWMIIVLSGMLSLGFCARSLTAGIANPEQVLFVMSRQMLPPVLAGLMTAGVLSAIMSTADSQLLVAASSISRDWNLEQSRRHSQVLTTSRVVVTLVTLLACLVAIFAPQTIFERVLFAWHGVGSAFAPLLILRVCGFRVRGRFAIASQLLGFGLTAIFHWLPDTPGDIVERALPFLIALAVAIMGARAGQTK